ncbi:MAG: M56 family metallopeptidase [Gemmatimonadota bacterium]|jgi:TonB family protein
MIVWLLYTVATSALVVVAALAADGALRRAGRAARWVWLSALLVAVALPVLAWLEPGAVPAVVPALPANVIALPAIGADVGSSGGSLAVEVVAVWSWVAISAVLLVLAFLSAGALWRRRRHWRPTEVDGVPVLVSADTGPAALGVVKSAVVVPEWALALVQPRRRMLVTHEHEHVRAKDPALQLAGLLLVVAMPWNPVLWWLLARLRLAIELDCDARVLRRETDAHTYGTLLLEVGRRRSGLRYAAVGMAESPSMLERRIRMIGRPFARNRWAIAGLAVTAGVALALACEAPTPTSERQVIKPSDGSADKTLTVAPLMKVDEDCSPAYLLNGKAVDDQAIRSLTPDMISRIEVLKGARAMEDPESLHLDAHCGIIKIYTKDGDTAEAVRERTATGNPKALKEYQVQEQQAAGNPVFTPFTDRPVLANKEETMKALEAYYPPLLRDAGIGGTTKVWVYIDGTGNVVKTQINKGSGHEALDQAALRVAGMMKFTPARNKGENVPVWVSIPIVFKTQ